MASAEEYAGWIVANKDKQGTPEFETVAKAYQIARTNTVETKPASTGDRTQAALGGVNRGIAGLVGLPVDTAENLVNLGIAGVGSVANALGKPDYAPNLIRGTPGGSESISRGMERIGIGTANPRPDDPASRMLHTGGVIAGGSIVPGASVKGALAAATGGAVAGEALGPEWTGVGALAPAAASQAATSVKNAVAARSAPIVDTFKQAGTMPSVGQATDNVFLHGLENLAAKFPGGSGIMKAFIENQQKQMGMTARTGTPAEAAGRAIEKGVTGQGGFLDRTKATWNMLDETLAAKIPKDTVIKPTNTLQALDELASPVKSIGRTHGMANLLDDLKAFVSGEQVGHHGAVGAETGQVTFQDLRSLRSRVGELMDDSLVSGIQTGEAKRLYSALSKDLEAAAVQAGAGDAFARQNNYYRARMGRIEDVLDRVIGKGKQPEDIFKAVNPTDPDQANKVRSVMRSLEPAERKIVSEAVANRLGRATPGNQNDLGEIFSSETFLTNWNKLSPGAKAQFFPDPPLREGIEKIAKAASIIRTGKGIYANPSGTAGSFAAYSVYASPVAALATGTLAPVLAAGGAAGSAYIGAKMLTNPKIVEWLATPVKPSTPQAAAHLARLGVIYNNSKDDALKGELAQFIASANKE